MVFKEILGFQGVGVLSHKLPLPAGEGWGEGLRSETLEILENHRSKT